MLPFLSFLCRIILIMHMIIQNTQPASDPPVEYLLSNQNGSSVAAHDQGSGYYVIQIRASQHSVGDSPTFWAAYQPHYRYKYKALLILW